MIVPPYAFFLKSSTLVPSQSSYTSSSSICVTSTNGEILYFINEVDEFAIKMLNEYEGKKFQNITSKEVDIESEEEKSKTKEEEKKHENMFKIMKEALKDKVLDVTISNKLKNSSSEFNVNQNMTKTMNNKRSFQGNNLSAKKEINLSSNNNLFKQKYTKKNINQIQIYNQINNLGKNSHKNLSRNINNMKSLYNAQSIKFITSSEINDINKLVYRK